MRRGMLQETQIPAYSGVATTWLYATVLYALRGFTPRMVAQRTNPVRMSWPFMPKR